MRLTKRQLSLRFHVDDTTIYLWERNRARPSLAQIPKIIEFMGRNPFEKEPVTLEDKIREYRRVRELSQKKLAGKLGIDPSTVAGWERGEHHPTGTHVEKMKSILVPRNP